MASVPGPMDFLSGLGPLPKPYDAQQQVISDQQQQQGNQQALQMGALKLAAIGQQQQQEQQYQTDVQSALHTGNFADLYAKYPDRQKALQAAHDALDEPAKRTQERDLYAVSSFIKNGAVDSARALLQKHVDAAKAAGQSADDDQQMLDALNSGDPNQVKAAADMALYAILPADKRAEIFGKTDGKNHYTPLGDGRILDQATGEVTGDTRRKFKTITVKNADGSESVIQVPEDGYDAGGGGQASSGGAPAGSAGAPVSTRNNNPGAIRFDPNNQWQGQTGQDGGFVTFDTPANGARAHQKLIANQIKNGFDTPLAWAQHYAPASDGNDPAAYAQTIANGLGIGVNDKIPLGAVPKMAALSAKVEAGGTPAPQSAQNGPKVLFTSKGSSPDGLMSDDEVNFYAQRVAGGADLPPLGMGKDAAKLRQRILGKAADIAISNGINGGQANLIKADLKANTHSLTELTKMQTFVDASERTASLNADQVLRLAPLGVGGNTPIFNRWIQAGRKEVKGDPALSKFALAIDTLANEYAKVMTTNTGTGGATSDSARAEAHGLLSQSATLQQLQGTIHQMRIDMNNRHVALETQKQILSGNISGGMSNVAPARGGPQMPPDVAAILKKYGH
jgi:hypothetical protein